MIMDWRVEILECLASTQDVVKARAESGAAEGLVVQALRQEAGRGRQAREWVSPEGNLYLSLLLRPECCVADVGKISLMIGVALARAIAEFSDVKPMLKWPNDVLLGGKKCAGILIESDLRADGAVNWLVVGFGVNIASAPEIGAVVGGVTVDVFQDRALVYIADLYKVPFVEVRDMWLSYAHKVGAALRVEIDGAMVEGSFLDIDADGNLLLDVGGETVSVSSGDVYLSEGA